MGQGEIKCTFEKCFERFPSVEAMKKHKVKKQGSKNPDDIHDFYCRKCDEDCADDLEWMLHQLSSPKHIICPQCGQDFKSESGRDRHIGLSHRQQQRLKCQGCGEIFPSAAGLIGHIEGNKCKVIKRDDLLKHQAEQKIQEDAFQQQLEGGAFAGASVVNTSTKYSTTDSETGGGTSLAEDQRVYNPRHWDEPASQQEDLFGGGVGSVSQNMSELAIDKYPPLVASSTAQRSDVASRRRYLLNDEDDAPIPTSSVPTGNASDLLGSEISSSRTEQKPWSEQLPTKASVWGSGRAPLASRQTRQVSTNLLDRQPSSDLLDPSVISNDSIATQGTRPSQLVGRGDTLPPAARAENQDPNAPYAQVQTQERLKLPSHINLENFWNSVMSCYVCPGDGCGKRLGSVPEFEEHLLSGVHMIGPRECPNCKKKFKTTTALVAHAESGSIKCDLRHTEEYDLVMRKITGGLLKVDGNWTLTGNAKFESVPVEDWNRPASYW